MPSGKRYSFPEDLVVVRHGGKWLPVAVDTACWIVLDNAAQLDFFNLLREHTLGESLELFHGEEADAAWVVTQLEARHFESPERRPFREAACNISLTTACNLRCRHCYLSAGMPTAGELTSSEVLSLLDNVAGQGTREVTLSGGEVALRADLPLIARHAKSRGLDIHLLTNGTLWTAELLEQVAPYIAGVQVSIDGFDEQENSLMRGPGVFDKALRALDGFAKQGLRVRVAITPFPTSNLAQKIERYASFAKWIAQKYAESDIKVLFTTNILDGRELQLSDEEREAYRLTMVETLHRYLGPDATDNPFIITHLERRIMENCSYGSLHVASNGDVRMCSLEGCKPVANIRRDNFALIDRLSRDAQEATSVNKLAPCRDCELKYICGGGCRVKEFAALRTAPAHIDGVPSRQCAPAAKGEFYDQMIRTNQAIFS